MSKLDKKLLNISVADGGFGYTVKGKPAVRATLVQLDKAKEQLDGDKYIDTILENNHYSLKKLVEHEYVAYAKGRVHYCYRLAAEKEKRMIKFIQRKNLMNNLPT